MCSDWGGRSFYNIFLEVILSLFRNSSLNSFSSAVFKQWVYFFDWLSKKSMTGFFFLFLACHWIVSVYSGVSVYFATEQYIVHSLSEGGRLLTRWQNEKKTLCQLLVGTCLSITLLFKALPVDFMDGLSGNAVKFTHWIIAVTPPLRLLHSCEPYVKASKRLKANWNFFSALRMHLNKQGVRGKIKMKCTWTTGTKQNKKDKVQNLCN